MKNVLPSLILLLALALSGCAAAPISAAAEPTTAPPRPSATPRTAAPTAPPSPAPPQPTTAASAIPRTPAATALPTLGPDEWQTLPVVPTIGAAPARIYARGLELGNNPRAFAKIGDCGSTPTWFLGDFDRGPRFYRLGEYTNLQGVIDYYAGSFERVSLGAKAGFNVSSVFTALWADRDNCLATESPLACEIRVQRPTVAFIILGTNDIWHIERFEPGMRQIIEYTIDQGVIPILTTKADNGEAALGAGDQTINRTLAQLAREYDLPLWNYWRAAQELPDGGLQDDGAHLTWAPNRFDDPRAMRTGWAVRNLTALQTLDAVWRAITPP